MTDLSSNRSALKDFIGTIASVQGDLSNITAPPFLLAEHSTAEIPQYWANHPKLFVTPALAEDPAERALLILKWFLGSLKNQQYAGRDPSEGVKKPLNAFLGELFVGEWSDSEAGETHLVAEQVSHHPPVTACYFRNEKFGITGQGFTCQEITFSTNVNIKQKGYAIQHLEKWNEDYLIPVPNVKIKGVLGGTLYPELSGKYSIPSSSGYVSEIKFEGKGLLGGGTKNGVEARVFHVDSPDVDVYTISGSWVEQFTIHDCRAGKDIETYNVDTEHSTSLAVPPIEEQDPWESGRAWSGVRSALRAGDMAAVTKAKSTIEEGQRKMRREDKENRLTWVPIFFQKMEGDEVFDKLSAMTKDEYGVDGTGGFWKADEDAVRNIKRPFHGGRTPDGRKVEEAGNEELLAQKAKEHSSPSPSRNGRKSQDSVRSNGDTAPTPVSQEQNGAPKVQQQAQQLPIREKPQGKSRQNSPRPAPAKRLDTTQQVEEMLRVKYSSA